MGMALPYLQSDRGKLRQRGALGNSVPLPPAQGLTGYKASCFRPGPEISMLAMETQTGYSFIAQKLL